MSSCGHLQNRWDALSLGVFEDAFAQEIHEVLWNLVQEVYVLKDVVGLMMSP